MRNLINLFSLFYIGIFELTLCFIFLSFNQYILKKKAIIMKKKL